MKLEIFFDYLCEFCEMGQRNWNALLPRYPRIEPVWRPCEAHPRATEPGYGMHSDLAAQGMLFLQERGGDVAAYNDALFAAAWRRGEDLEDVGLLARYAQRAGAQPAAFTAALQGGAYAPALREQNLRAWGALGFQAVPSFLLEDGRRLDAVLGVGVSRQQLERFLQGAG